VLGTQSGIDGVRGRSRPRLIFAHAPLVCFCTPYFLGVFLAGVPDRQQHFGQKMLCLGYRFLESVPQAAFCAIEAELPGELE